MEVGKLTVQTRENSGKGVSRQLRAKGFVPGVCYGAGLDQPLSIAVDPKALKASLDPVKRQNTVIDVTFEGAGPSNPVKVMLWDYQIHPIRRNVTHVDLVAIDPDKPVDAEVPVVLIGRAKGLIDGGQLHVARHSVDIKAKPADIPTSFELNVSDLDVGQVRHVSDLTIPSSVHLVSSTTLTLVTCVAPKADKTAVAADEAEEAVAAAPAADAKKKKEKEEEGDKK